MPSHFVGARLPAELVERAKGAAADDHRSLSNYILKLIQDDLDRRETISMLNETAKRANFAAAAAPAQVRYPRGTKKRVS